MIVVIAMSFNVGIRHQTNRTLKIVGKLNKILPDLDLLNRILYSLAVYLDHWSSSLSGAPAIGSDRHSQHAKNDSQGKVPDMKGNSFALSIRIELVIA